MLDMFFPARCPVCKDIIPLKYRIRLYEEVLPAGKRPDPKKLYPSYICDSCLREIDFISPPFCKKCGRQLQRSGESGVGDGSGYVNGSGVGDGLCSECRKRSRAFIECRCVMTYDDLSRNILAELKYKGKKEYAPLLSLLAADRCGDWIRDIDPDAIIPVPVHKKRLKERGYNQAELIARGLGRLMGIPVITDALFRVKNTKAQKTLGADERLLNLRDAFYADLSKSRLKRVKDPVVLLVDDIFTTGMTLNICAEKLLSAGVSKVYGLSVASGEDVEKGKRSE